MQVDNFLNGGDPNLDELLRQSFLDLNQNNPANDQLIDAASKDVFSKDWPVEINKAKEAQLLNSAKTGSKMPWILGGAAGIALLVTAYALFNSYSGNKNQETAQDTTQNISPLNTNNDEKNEKQTNFNSENETNANQTTSSYAGSTSQSQHHGTELISNPLKTNNTNVTSGNSSNNSNNTVGGGTGTSSVTTTANSADDKDYSKNPALGLNLLSVTYGMSSTQAEKLKAETIAETEKLVNEASSLILSNYTHMSGPSDAAGTGQAMSTDFYIKQAEISVREYKAFLNDLLLNGRTEDYDKARPKHREMLNAPEQESERAFFDKYFRKYNFN